MSESDAVWAGLLVAGAAYEVYTLATRRQGDTLSERVRVWGHLKSGKGFRVAFLVAYIGFFGWWIGHLMDWWR